MPLSDCENQARPERVLPHYGQAVRGENRWPRWDLECPIARLLLEGNSASLFGLRRIGKSSLLVGIQDLITRAGAVPVALELQGANRIESLVAKLIDACERQGERGLAEAMRSHYTSAALKMPARVRAVWRLFTGGGDDQAAPMAGAQDVLDYLEVALGPLADRLSHNERRIVLFLDELPFFCQDLHEHGGAERRHVTAFLAELRRWRGEGLTMLVGGSVGVHRLERDLGVDPNLFGDLTHERLPPLSAEEATALVDALARGCGLAGWTPEHRAAVLAAPPAAYPGFFHAIFLDLRRTARGGAPSAEQAAAVAGRATERLLQENFFPQFNHRLEHYEDAEAVVAIEVFRRLGQSAADLGAAELAGAFPQDWPLKRRTALMSALIQDDFIRKLPGNRFAFATPLAAAWWSERDPLA